MAGISKEFIDLIGTQFAKLDRSNTFGGSIYRKADSQTRDIGSPDAPWDNIYANSIVASIIVGQITGSEWEAIGDMIIDAHSSAGDTTLYVVNQDGTNQASLDVEKDIVVGGLVDGVDLGNFNAANFLVTASSTYMANERIIDPGDGISGTDGGAGNNYTLAVDYGSGLTISGGQLIHNTGSMGDMHTNYAETAANETITGTWDFPATGLTIGSDVTLKRDSANVLGIPDNVDVSLHMAIGSGGTIYDYIALHVYELFDETSGNVYGGYFQTQLAPASGFTTTAHGFFSSTLVSAAQTQSSGSIYGARTSVTILGSTAAVLNNAEAIFAWVDIEDGSATTASGARIDTPWVDEGSIGTGYGLHIVEGVKGSGSITNLYGLKIEHVNDATTLNYSIYTGEGTVSLGDDMEFRQAAIISTTGSANISLKPGGDIYLDPDGYDVLPYDGYEINLGSLAKKYLTLHCAELWVETLVAQNTIATIGGRILVGPTTTLEADLAPSDTYMTVKHNEMVNDDIPYMEANGKVEFMQISGYTATASAAGDTFTVAGVDLTSLLAVDDYFTVVDGKNPGEYTIKAISFSTNTVIEVYEDIIYDDSTSVLLYEGEQGVGPFTYLLVTRSIDPGSAQQWYAGDAVFNTGQTDDGFIDIYSVDGVADTSQYGPTIVGNVRTGSTYNQWVEHWAIGNLNGVYGYGTNVYGVGLGKYASGENNITIDAEASGGIRFRSYTTVVSQWDGTTITIGNTASEHLNITSTTLQFKNSGTVCGSLTDTTLTLGQTGAGNEYVTIDSTNGIRMYGNGVQHVGITTAGTFWAGDTSTTERIQWDTTYGVRIYNASNEAIVSFPISGDASIVGTLSITGSGELTIGSTPDVIINADGIRLEDGNNDVNKIRWYYTSGTSYLITSLYASVSGATAYTYLVSKGASATITNGQLTLSAQEYDGSPLCQLTLSSSTQNASLSGNLVVTGSITKGGYAGYIFVPLTTPYTNTGFDGDSFSSVSATKIENTSWSTTIPATAKAILIRCHCRDSGSAANDTYVALYSDGTNAVGAVRIYGKPDDSIGEATMVVPCTDGDIWYGVQASGTLTMDIWLRVFGYWI